MIVYNKVIMKRYIQNKLIFIKNSQKSSNSFWSSIQSKKGWKLKDKI
jgi:hypothetical protein